MRIAFRCVPLFVVIAALLTIRAPADDFLSEPPQVSERQQISNDIFDAQPQLVRIAATVDGSGRIIFTGSKVTYKHKHWGKPTLVYFDGTPWANLDTTPAPWTDYGSRLDLSKAWVVRRQGRDVIALEHTPDGFDLHLCDSPNGSANYDVTIAIPRRK